MNTLAVAAVTTLLSGGLVGGIASFITGRATYRKVESETAALDQRLPFEVDSVIVAGAEQAVLTMDKALQAADKRIAALEAQRDRDRQEVDTLRRHVDECQRDLLYARQDLDACQTRLLKARKEASALAARLEARDNPLR